MTPANDEPTRGASVPAPMFDRERLENLLHATPNVVCECPNHLAALTIAMREFELYSLRCESKTPEGALLRGHLAKVTGQMRGNLEQLLVRVCTHDGIPVQASVGSTSEQMAEQMEQMASDTDGGADGVRYERLAISCSDADGDGVRADGDEMAMAAMASDTSV